MTPEMKPHPFAEEYPSVSAEKLTEITDNMREHGYDRRFPTVVYRNMILDGRTREKAAKAAGIKPKRITFKGTVDQAHQFVETANLHRRHLTTTEQEERKQARVGRVVEARQEGQSIRAIAEAEEVSTATVQRDLETAHCDGGVTVTPLDGKVTGKDGRQQPATKPDRRCHNCIRKYPDGGHTKGCEGCAAERSAAKSGRTEPGTHTPRPSSGKGQGGKAAFDWRPLRDGYGQLMRQVDTFAKLYGVRDSGEAERLRDDLVAWKKKFEEWAATTSRMPVPAH
jgi:hypothetical protein